jgi:hypothetical protein
VLPAEWLYVVDSDVELLAWAFPASGLTIHKEVGPMKVRGKFVGGAGKIETKSFAGKQILIVTSTTTTTEATLMILPLGATKESDAIMKQFVVTTSPDPPDPKPPVPTPVTSFRVIFVTESATQLTAQQTAVSGAKSVRDYLNAKTTPDKMSNGQDWPGWREFDPQVTGANELPGIKGVWDAAKPKVTTVPCLVVQVNEKIDILPYPKNAAECLTTLQSYGGKP